MISRKDFSEGNFERIEIDLKDNSIFKFLIKNSKNAYTVKEIRKGINFKKTEYGIRGYLKRAEKKGVILHSAPYYIAKMVR